MKRGKEGRKGGRGGRKRGKEGRKGGRGGRKRGKEGREGGKGGREEKEGTKEGGRKKLGKGEREKRERERERERAKERNKKIHYTQHTHIRACKLWPTLISKEALKAMLKFCWVLSLANTFWKVCLKSEVLKESPMMRWPLQS